MSRLEYAHSTDQQGDALNQPMFKTESGRKIPGVTLDTLLSIRQEVAEVIGVGLPAIVEAASYSMAMVVRYALGLSAENGKVCAVYTHGFASAIALGTVRHIFNSNADGVCVRIGPHIPDPLVDHQVEVLKKLGVSFLEWNTETDRERMFDAIATCHNVLSGLFVPHGASTPLERYAISSLNESAIPIHAVESPAGISPDTGEIKGEPLFASSTLSIGMPLVGLFHGRDYVGRHYACDASIPPGLYERAGYNEGSLFTEQPVVRLYPDIQAEA